VYGYAYKHLLAPFTGRASRVLDCGTGAGLLLQSFPGHGALYGVDLSINMLRHARRRLPARARLLAADLSRLPFRDGEMDVVMSALVLEHVANPVEALAEMVRVARTGATVLIVATRPGAPDRLFRLLFRYRHYREAEMFDWMGRAGIRDIEVKPLAGVARWFAQAYEGTTR
jgi:demethylmenaquinone methyltransferase/2-methoxy-6-polyprenyl-1,4-benzoquinol methylase